MARIIYAVAGEGFGHSSRSHIIGKRLIEAGHDVMFAGSNKSYTYLKENFGDRVKEVFGLLFCYKNGRVNPIRTVLKNIAAYPKGFGINRRLYKNCFSKFKPDLVISDFEPFSAWWAIRHRVPFFSIDHQHMLTHCELEKAPNQFFARLNAYVITRYYYFWANSYIIINFFKAPTKSRSAVVAPPVVRPEVAAVTPSDGDHIVIYTTAGTNEEKFRQILHSFSPQKFFVYGFNKFEEAGNITFKERSTEGFLADVGSSKGVAASAGFSLISECMYLKKKMLLLPLPGQYEQIINAHYVKKLGLGLSRWTIDKQSMSDFLAEIEKPMPADPDINWPSNEGFFEVLKTRLAQLPNPIKL